ncbi:MAG: flavodoxin family protein [Deltaproteobacteria bacterium]|nr:flavodoxin family protein [Candidatus Anaeroferrophillacea bacterium]
MIAEKKKIAALLASPRKPGNGEILVKELCRRLPVPHELDLIRLSGHKIRPCRACYQCLATGVCPLKDDYAEVLDRLARADAVIIVSPCYLMGPSGLLKVFLDRGLQLFSRRRELQGKPAVNLVTAGIAGEAGYTEAALNSMTLIMGMRLVASEVFIGALPGEVLWHRPDEAERVGRIAARIFSGEPRSFSSWCCPLCGSDTMQLLGADRVQCQVCRNFGTIRMENGEPRLHITLKDENIFFTPEQAEHHHQWLMGMKERFLAVRRELGVFLANYADEETDS